MAILFDFNGTMFFDGQFQEISWRKFVGEKIGRNSTVGRGKRKNI